MDAHDHALVHGVVGSHKHTAAVVQLAQGVGEDFTVVHRDQHAVLASADVALVRLVTVENIGNQARTAGQVEEFVRKTNQSAGGNAVFQTHTATAIGFHVDQLALTLTQRLHHAALVLLFNVGGHHLDRLVLFAVYVFEHHARLAHCHFVAFATHVFQQDGQVQFATAHHFKHTLFVGFVHAQGHVVLQLFLQSIPNLAAGHELAFAAGQWAGVDAEVHGQGRLVHFQHGQRLGIGRVGHCDADADIFNAVDQHNVAGTSSKRLHAVQTLEGQHLVDASFHGLAVRAFHDHHVLHRL